MLLIKYKNRRGERRREYAETDAKALERAMALVHVFQDVEIWGDKDTNGCRPLLGWAILHGENSASWSPCPKQHQGGMPDPEPEPGD